MVKPYYIETILDGDDSNNVVFQQEVIKSENIISESVAKQLQELMYNVVHDHDGTARFYKIPEVDIIAKTGTSEIAAVGGYEGSNKVITSIMAALPSDDPKYLIYYAFESEYSGDLHTKTEAIKSLLRKVAMHNIVMQQADVIEYDEIEKNTMNSYINNSVDYSIGKLTKITNDIIVIGNGNTIISQSPKPNHNLVTNQKVFLLTSYNEIEMPNMTGWTRKDVTEFWNLTKIAFRINGEGNVYQQSITANSIINELSLIEVRLKSKEEEFIESQEEQ